MFVTNLIIWLFAVTDNSQAVTFYSKWQPCEELFSDPPSPSPLSSSISFLSNLESTQWLHNLSQLISVACDVVHTVHDEARPVLVHCSDGWDRTAQVVPLAELMLDPYYRTIEVQHVESLVMDTIERNLSIMDTSRFLLYYTSTF